MALNFNKNFYLYRGLAFTDDGVLIYNIVAYNVPRYLRHEDIAAHFEKYGEVLRVSMFTHRTPARRHKAPKMAFINFANAMVAASILQKGKHIIGGKRVFVKACDSWRQPHGDNFIETTNKATDTHMDKKNCAISRSVQTLPLNYLRMACNFIQIPDSPCDSPTEPTAINIGVLNDDCLMLICRKLTLKEQIAFAMTCQRFRYIAELCFRIEYRELFLDIFYDCSLAEIYVFLELAGPYIEVVSGCMPLHNRDRIAEFVRKYCYNLHVMKLTECKMRATSLTQLLNSLTDITELALIDCGLQNDAVRTINKLRSLTTLKLDNNGQLTGKHLEDNKRVQELSLAGCVALKLNHMIVALKELKELRNLNIQRVVRLVTLPLHIREHCHNLETIKVTIVENYDWMNLAHIENMKHLYINFLDPDLIMSNEFFAQISKKKQMLSLDIVSRRSVTPTSMSFICQMEQLQTFNCVRNLNINDQSLLLLSEMPNLANINLSGCVNFKKHGFTELIRNCVNLKKLSVQYCYQIVPNYIYDAINVVTKQRSRTSTPLQILVYRTSVNEQILNENQVKRAEGYLKLSFETKYKLHLCHKHFTMFHYGNEEYEDWTDEEGDDSSQITSMMRQDVIVVTSSDNESNYQSSYSMDYEYDGYYDSSD